MRCDYKNLTVNQRVTESFTYSIADTNGLSDVGKVEFKVTGSRVMEGDDKYGFVIQGSKRFKNAGSYASLLILYQMRV